MELDAVLKEKYPFKENYLELSHGKMHYLDEGDSKDVFVLVHGNPTWSFYYRNLVKFLSSRYRVIVPDHMGCGKSQKPTSDYEYTLSQRIMDLKQLLSHLEIDSYHLIVHDWGGAIGIGNAVDQPKRLKSLTILNTAAFKSQTIPFTIRLCKIPIFGDFIVRYLNAFCFPATFMASEKPLSGSIKRAYLAPYKGVKSRKAISEFVKDIPLSPSHRSYHKLDEIEKKLSQLTCPKLILWGGKDFCFNDHFYQKWIEIFPEAKRRYFEKAGHYILEDEPFEVESELKSFLESLDGHS